MELALTLGGGDIYERIENASNQLVPYDNRVVPYGNTIGNPSQDALFVPDPPTGDQVPSFRSFLVPLPSGARVLPSVGTFTAQCEACLKWRVIPTKEKYEEIRASIVQFPFVCEKAREWRPSITCDDREDITQDDSKLWAMDKPNIPQPPPGWERLLRIRSEGSSKFADIYYVSPSGRKLRSIVEIEKYLLQNQDYLTNGVNISQFSFLIPKPLQEDYVRKRSYPRKVASASADMQTPHFLEQDEVIPLSWAAPLECIEWPEPAPIACGGGESSTISPPIRGNVPLDPSPSSVRKKKRKKEREGWDWRADDECVVVVDPPPELRNGNGKASPGTAKRKKRPEKSACDDDDARAGGRKCSMPSLRSDEKRDCRPPPTSDFLTSLMSIIGGSAQSDSTQIEGLQASGPSGGPLPSNY